LDLTEALNSFANDDNSLRHSREDLFGAVELHLLPSGKVLIGKAVNLSAGGIGVVVQKEGAKALIKGDQIHLDIVWADGESLSAKARVAWADHAKKDGCLYGLVFEHLDQATSDSIHRHLIKQVVDRHLDDS
jgi:hypothetical protein